MSFTTDTPDPSATVTRPDRPAVATWRPDTSTRVPRRRWAILSRVGPSVRTVIVPVRSLAAAAARAPSFQLSDVLVPGSG
jgi:hypothetical protein